MPTLNYQDFVDAIRRKMSMEPQQPHYIRDLVYRPGRDSPPHMSIHMPLPENYDPDRPNAIFAGNSNSQFINAAGRKLDVAPPSLQTATPSYFSKFKSEQVNRLPDLKNLFASINQRGSLATEGVLNAINKRRMDEALRLGNMNFGGTSRRSPGGNSNYQFMSSDMKLPKNLGRLMRAISIIESGGSYGARNRSTGAMGKYQILPGNIAGSGGWDKAALGFNISVNQFMNNPSYQDRIASYMLGKYLNKYGPAGAALAWYAGPGVANRRLRRGQGYGHSSGYVNRVMRYY